MFTREEFETQYGIDPLTLKIADPLREKWFEYRQNKITNFVTYAKNLTKDTDIMLTTVIFTNREESLETKMQDWKTWSKQNLVDGFTPLMLTTDKKRVGSIIHEMQGEISFSTKIYPGIFVMFMGAPIDELLMQLHETSKMHANGLILFDYAHFYPQYQEALKTRAFNIKS